MARLRAWEALLPCENLNRLGLSTSGITDAGLEILKEMKTLRTLAVDRTKVTPAGVAAFRKARPDVKVTF